MSSVNRRTKHLVFLNPNAVSPGDVLVSTTRAPLSRLIRVNTKSKFSHAAIAQAASRFFEATGKGVYSLPLKLACFVDMAGMSRVGLLLPDASNAALLRNPALATSQRG